MGVPWDEERGGGGEYCGSIWDGCWQEARDRESLERQLAADRLVALTKAANIVEGAWRARKSRIYMFRLIRSVYERVFDEVVETSCQIGCSRNK